MHSKRAVPALAAGLLLAAASVVTGGPREKTEARAPEGPPRGQGGSVVAAAPGQPAPDFTLKDLEGAEHRLSALLADDKVVVLEWFNPDCPFVKKHHEKNKTMAMLAARYRDKGVVWLAVNSGAPGKQGHGAERNRKARTDYGIEYPILLDEDGQVGRAYGAKTSPHMFVIAGGEIAYAGAIDDNPSPGTLGKTSWVEQALEAVLAGKPVETKETKPYGCSVKYGAAVP